MMSCFTLNFFLSGVKGKWGTLYSMGLLNFGVGRQMFSEALWLNLDQPPFGTLVNIISGQLDPLYLDSFILQSTLTRYCKYTSCSYFFDTRHMSDQFFCHHVCLYLQACKLEAGFLNKDKNVVQTAKNQNICRPLSHSVFDCGDKENCQLWKIRDLGKWYFVLLFSRATSTILIRK